MLPREDICVLSMASPTLGRESARTALRHGTTGHNRQVLGCDADPGVAEALHERFGTHRRVAATSVGLDLSFGNRRIAIASFDN